MPMVAHVRYSFSVRHKVDPEQAGDGTVVSAALIHVDVNAAEVRTAVGDVTPFRGDKTRAALAGRTSLGEPCNCN